MALVLLQVELVREVVHLSVHAHADEAGLPRVVEDLEALALAVLDDGREDHQPASGRQFEDRVDDLLHGLPLDYAPAIRTVRRACASEEQTQVVVDLGLRADGRTWVPARTFLVDRDRGRKPLDVVDVGLLHLPEELARIGGERFHVATLALRVDRVEGERTLARAREARDHDQLVARDLQIDILQVVFARTLDDDRV